ncbi:pneumococcal-type histidine triad protein, partial [Gemella sp. GH3]|uniref:pneumococcal-type histidine triad protein n=1 Tax=unclassified Gemella TaxID=2624949 RepID=UPI0015D0A9A9
MNKNKKIIIGTTGVITTCLLTFGIYKFNNNDNNNQEKQNITTINSNLDNKKINYKDKISTVVVSEITEDGYVAIHDDHTHFEKGIVPYNAKILDTLVMKDVNYVLKEDDIQYELAQGYVIKVNNKFYYYPKKNVEQTNIVTEEEAKKITKNNYKDSTNSKDSTNGIAGIDYPTSDGFIFSNEGQIMGRTVLGLILSHNGHAHFIPYSQLRGTKWEYLIPNENNKYKMNSNINYLNNKNNDGYIFDPNDIVGETENGYIVRHGDHFHFIPKKYVNIEIPSISTQDIPNQKDSNETKKDIEDPNYQTSKLKFSGIDFPTSDGFIFNGQNIESHTDYGIIVNHDGHSHFIPYYQLVNSTWENLIPKEQIKKARDEYNKKLNIDSNNINTNDKDNNDTDLDIDAKRNYLAKQLDLNVNSIKIVETNEGLAFIYPHGDHSHSILVKNVDINKPIEDPHHDHHHNNGTETLKKLGFDDETINDIIHANAETDFPKDETDTEKMKEWLKAVKYINIGQKENPLKRKGLELMPNIEVLGVGFTQIDDVTPLYQFKKLKHLWLTKTGIKDYAFLKNIPTLEGIDISQNDISDISFLEEYPNLKSIAIAGSNITDITVLSKLKKLESLNLDYNNIKDLSPLKNLNNLNAVSLENNNIVDISPLNNKSNLTRLFLSNNPKINLENLEAPSLEELTVNDSNLDNVKFLSNLPKIKSLVAKNNKIKDLEKISNNSLVALNLENNNLTTLQGIDNFSNLENLNVSKNKITNINIQKKQNSLSLLNIENNILKSLEGINNFTTLITLNANSNFLN